MGALASPASHPLDRELDALPLTPMYGSGPSCLTINALLPVCLTKGFISTAQRANLPARVVDDDSTAAIARSNSYEPTLMSSVMSLAMIVRSDPNTPAGMTNFPP